MRILIPLDGSLLAEMALDSAVTLARAFAGAIHLVQVLPSQTALVGSDREQDDQAHLYLSTIYDRLRRQGITVDRTLAWGHPAEAISTASQRTHSDLIVMATHGHARILRLLEGSVADAVLHQVGVPVLVIHPAPDDLISRAPAVAVAAMTVAEQRLRALLSRRV